MWEAGELLSCVPLGIGDHSGREEWQPSMAPTAWAGAQVPRRDLDPECEDLWARMQEAGPRCSSPRDTSWTTLSGNRRRLRGGWETHQRIR